MKLWWTWFKWRLKGGPYSYRKWKRWVDVFELRARENDERLKEMRKS